MAVDGDGAVLHRRPRQPRGAPRSAPTASSPRWPATARPASAATAAWPPRRKLRSPRDVAVRESDGSVFVADGGNHRVRRIDPDGTIETVAGDGSDGYRGDGGDATVRVSLDMPSAMIPTRDGGLLIADAGNATLRKVAPQGTIDTVAGNGTPGLARRRRPGGAGADRLPAGDHARRRRHDLPRRLRQRPRAGARAVRSRGCRWRSSRSRRSTAARCTSSTAAGRHLRTIDSLTRASHPEVRLRQPRAPDRDRERRRAGHDDPARRERRPDRDRRAVRPDDGAVGRRRLPEPRRQRGRRPDALRVRRRPA